MLSHSKHLLGDHISYVDITFCSLLAPMLCSRLLGAKKSLYAAGRFSSFDGSASVFPQELLEEEEALFARPSGKYIFDMYENWRKKKL